jgi:CheY-like chemotaxis protein
VGELAIRTRVLLVDDEASLRELGTALLESQGYEVHCAGDGLEGLAALKKLVPQLIVSDLRMPNMNGFEFLRVVRERFPAVPVIVLSGEFSGRSVPEGVLADAFFAKGSYKTAELFQKIVELLAQLPERVSPARTTHLDLWARNDRDPMAAAVPCCARAFRRM